MKISLASLLGFFVVSSVVACTSSASSEGALADEDSDLTGASYECTKPETSGRLGATGGFPRVVAARAAGHPGFDRFVIELSGPGAEFHVEETTSSTFYKDASGEEMTMPGTAGLDVHVSGVDWTHSANVGDFSVGDAKIMTKVTPGSLFEGDLTIGIGLKRQGCYQVTQLTNPTRLVIDVQNDGAIPTWGAGPGEGPFACAYPAAGNFDMQIQVNEPGPHDDVATKLVRKRAGAHADEGYDRFVLEFSGGKVPPSASLRPQKSATFSGTGEQSIHLAGSAGLVLSAHGGVENVGATNVAAAPGTSAFMAAQQIENFEGYSDWAIGLSKEACYRTFTLTDPPRIVLDVKR